MSVLHLSVPPRQISAMLFLACPSCTYTLLMYHFLSIKSLFTFQILYSLFIFIHSINHSLSHSYFLTPTPKLILKELQSNMSWATTSRKVHKNLKFSLRPIERPKWFIILFNGHLKHPCINVTLLPQGTRPQTWRFDCIHFPCWDNYTIKCFALWLGKCVKNAPQLFCICSFLASALDFR